MAFLRFSALARFTLHAAYALIFIPHTLLAQTAPALSSAGLFPELNGTLDRTLSRIQQGSEMVKKGARVVDGFITTEGEKDEEREREAARKAAEKMERTRKYLELKQQQAKGELKEYSTMLSTGDRQMKRSGINPENLFKFDSDGALKPYGTDQGPFTGWSYKERVLIPAAGLRAYFEHILTAP